ncbi:MAG: tryptophan synthase subunit alpha [Candidatus Omnitrophica bacterium]|nr:tryptophan synthase subunit alpha [Candidatus Omnitrophota bacterium]
MNRIDKTFKELKALNKTAFMPFITAGDPDIKISEKILRVLAESGADVIEIGVPFSDPVADGPTIQKAAMRAIDAGCTLKKLFELVEKLRKDIETPFVFMSYYNVIMAFGIKKFVQESKRVGVDGFIVPDLPLEESLELRQEAHKHDINLILLTAPTTPLNRFKEIAKISGGFVYHVSLTGVTGARKELDSRLENEVGVFKKNSSKPVCVGFGISTQEQAKSVASFADGVIVGSAIVKLVENNLGNEDKIIKDIEKFSKQLAVAVHCD